MNNTSNRTELVGHVRSGDIIKLGAIAVRVLEVVQGPTNSWACRHHGFYIKAALKENSNDVRFYGPYPEPHVVTFAD